MTKFTRIAAMVGIVSFLLSIAITIAIAQTTLNIGTYNIWTNQAIGDSIVSATYANKFSNARGKHWLQIYVTGPTDSCHVKFYKRYSSMILVDSFLWAPDVLIDSTIAKDTLFIYLPLFGADYVKFTAKPSVKCSKTNTKIYMTLVVK